MKQSRLASVIETWGSTATGFLLSLCIQWGVCWYYGLPLKAHENITIIGIFTVASLIRGYGWRRLMEHFQVRIPISAFAQAVLAERARQIHGEGWSVEHDDGHDHGELARAGGCYAAEAFRIPRTEIPPADWPWAQEWWKSVAPRRDLVKAAALIMAEGERFDRMRKRR